MTQQKYLFNIFKSNCTLEFVDLLTVGVVYKYLIDTQSLGVWGSWVSRW